MSPPSEISRNQMVALAVLGLALVAILVFQLRGTSDRVDSGVGVPDATTSTTSSGTPTTWTLPSEPRDPFTGASPSSTPTAVSTPGS